MGAMRHYGKRWGARQVSPAPIASHLYFGDPMNTKAEGDLSKSAYVTITINGNHGETVTTHLATHELRIDTFDVLAAIKLVEAANAAEKLGILHK